jgi:hypothetical protein
VGNGPSKKFFEQLNCPLDIVELGIVLEEHDETLFYLLKFVTLPNSVGILPIKP